MRRSCESCGRSYDDEIHSTTCPHRGIGFCAVCDCAICVCEEKSCGDWERANNNRMPPSPTNKLAIVEGQEIQAVPQPVSIPERARFMTQHRYNALSQELNKGNDLDSETARRIVLEFCKLEDAYARQQDAMKKQSAEMMKIRMDSEDVEALRAKVEGLEADRARLINRLSGGGMTMEEASMRVETGAAVRGQIMGSHSPGSRSPVRALPTEASVPETKQKPRGLVSRIAHAVLGDGE